MSKVWFITGTSRGLGRSLATAALAAGDYVAATARNPGQLKDLLEKYPEQVYPLQLDVTSKEQIAAAVEGTIKKFGRIDVLVNNAGFGIVGATEAYSDEQVRSQLETNLYAPIEITRTVLPYMRKQGSGRILQISSIGGRVGNAGLTIYQAAKFGLGGFSEALAKEVAPVGIKVTCVEPGGFRTDWVDTASMQHVPEVEGYEKTVGVRKTLFTPGNFKPMGDPDKAAKVMVELAEHPNPPVHLVLGGEAVALIKQANAIRDEDMEAWLPVSLSTSADDADDFTQTELGRSLFGAKK
jgi:NAD(P)-dependent dehydrogenase (short-subunit alcohol dehydrogenase family)